MANIAPMLKQHFELNGDPLTSGKLYSYIAGTNTPILTYKDSTSASYNTHPIILDSNGDCDLWLNPANAYKFKLATSTNVELWTVDNITANGVIIVSGGSTGNYLPLTGGTIDGLLKVVPNFGSSVNVFEITTDSISFGASALNTVVGGKQVQIGDGNNLQITSAAATLSVPLTLDIQKLDEPALIFRAGPLLTIPTEGVVEFDGFNFYITKRATNEFTDPYDGEVYKFVTIGSQVWMAQNYRANISLHSWQYDDNVLNRAIYGNLYDIHGATAHIPPGWHLPSAAEFDTLKIFVGASVAGKKLKASDPLWTPNTGTDDYGFNALPGGGWNPAPSGAYGGISINALFWTSTNQGFTPYYGTDAYDVRYLFGSGDTMVSNTIGLDGRFAVRYVKD